MNEYITQFTPLIDQLNAYGGTTDPLFYTMRFIDGLKDYIRAAVALHRSQNFDTACILARLQVEVADPAKKHDLQRWDNAGGMRPNLRAALPLPAPPPQLALPAPQAKVVPDGGRGPSTEERWPALRASRRAQGLCMRCGGKWARDHQSPQVVQLNIVQELLDVLQMEDPQESDIGTTDHAEEQMFLTLSVAAVSGIPIPRTMCF